MAFLNGNDEMQVSQNLLSVTSNLKLSLVTFFFSILFSLNSMSEVYRPSVNQVVASWDTQQSINNTRISLQNVAWHLQQSQFAGASNLHLRQASGMLDRLQETQADNAEYWYYTARVLEHQHQFSSALQALDQALSLDAKFASAWLMKSNVLLLMGQNEQAKKTCLSLMGLANIDLVLACSLQTAEGQEQVQQAYKQLNPIIKRIQQGSDNLDASNLWLVQVAADMAMQLGLNQQAADWLNTFALERSPISYMSQWADVQLALGQYLNVLNKLGAIVQQAAYQDDALLMRLAMAEINLKQNLNNANIWQLAAKDRVTLRLQRNDTYHAADLSRFYLYIQPNPEQALYWAQKNLLQSQAHEDQALLKAAEQMWDNSQLTVKES